MSVRTIRPHVRVFPIGLGSFAQFVAVKERGVVVQPGVSTANIQTHSGSILLLILSSALRRLINFAAIIVSDPMMSAIPTILAIPLTKLNS